MIDILNWAFQAALLISGSAILLSVFFFRVWYRQAVNTDTTGTGKAKKVPLLQKCQKHLVTAVLIVVLYAAVLFITETAFVSFFFLGGAVAFLLISGLLLLLADQEHSQHQALSSRSGKHRSALLLPLSRGLLISGFVILLLGALYTVIPDDDPMPWIFFGLGTTVLRFIQIAPGWRRQGTQSVGTAPVSDAAACPPAAGSDPNRYVDLYTVCMLAFSILMAMGYFIDDLVEGWTQIVWTLALSGTVAAVIGMIAVYLLAGRGRRWIVFMAVLLISCAMFWIVNQVMRDLPSQALADTGMLDRLGLCWSVVAGLIGIFLMRGVLYYYSAPDISFDERLTLIGWYERIGLTLFFPSMTVWVSYLLGGFYGIGLAVAGFTALLPLALLPDVRTKSVLQDPFLGSRREVVLEGMSRIASFLIVTAAAALVFLMLLADWGSDSRRLAFNPFIVTGGFCLGAIYPFIMAALNTGSVWKKFALPTVGVFAFVFLTGGLMGPQAATFFLIGAGISAFISGIVSFYRNGSVRLSERASFMASLCCMTVFVVSAFWPVLIYVFNSIY